MDRGLLAHYNAELSHLRHTAAEFAREFPKVAGRLGLDHDANVCADPFVERLLEGFAFLAARIQVKMDAEFPVFTQGLLETIYPHYLCPTPSMAVVELAPALRDANLAAGCTIPRGTLLRSSLGRGERTPCAFRTVHDVQLWPIELTGVDYFTRELGSFAFSGDLNVRAALRIRLRTADGIPFADLPINRLSFYIRGADDLPDMLYEQMFRYGLGIVPVGLTSEAAMNRMVLAQEALRPLGFAPDEALLPEATRSFSGYRLLREYFAFRHRFLFFEITNFRRVIAGHVDERLDLLILFDGQDTRLENRVDQSSLVLFCTPVINLFEKRLDRIPLDHQHHEYQVIADHTRPFDFEVFSIQSVTGYGMRASEEQRLEPFYLTPERLQKNELFAAAPSTAFYATRREPRRLTASERQFGKVSSYIGSEVFLSLVDLQSAPYHPDLQQLGVVALCTNRHLPLQIEPGYSGFNLEINVPVECVRCVTGPTTPQSPLAQGAEAWRLISHLSLNYFAFAQDKAVGNANALREMLSLYTYPADQNTQRLIEGILSAKVSPILRRLPGSGPITFGRGLEVELALNEAAFEGVGVFVFGAVMAQFFSRYTSLNSFTETVLYTQQRHRVMRWPSRVGTRGVC
jgi:type VI secretion system protein ImpG